MEWYKIIALLGTGLFAGFLNTSAGGGSMITVPLLMFLGLPANVANGTNRIAILLQNLIAVKTFRQKKVLNFKQDYKLTIPAVAGAIAGAFFAVQLPPELLKKIISILMIFLFLLVILKPELWIKNKAEKSLGHPTIFQYIIFFLIGFYGGFIQLGVGFLLLTGLVIGCGYDLVKANAIKVLIIFSYIFFTLGIFIINKQVDILAGLILAIGNMFGAWVGVNFAIKGGAKYTRYILIIALTIVILNLLGIF